MKQLRVTPNVPLDYSTARRLAERYASYDADMEDPVLLAWHDGQRGMMSPAIAGANIATRWHDFGESHCGCLEVLIGENYEFIYTDGAPYADYGPSPYINLSDSRGNQYICVARALKDGHTPDAEACVQLDEFTSKQT